MRFCCIFLLTNSFDKNFDCDIVVSSSEDGKREDKKKERWKRKNY